MKKRLFEHYALLEEAALEYVRSRRETIQLLESLANELTTHHCNAQFAKVRSTIDISHIGCVRLASLGQPRSAPVRSNSFYVIPRAHPGEPRVPCLWSGSLGAGPRCMTSPQEDDVTTRG